MKSPESLPAQLFLLAFDRRRQRLTGRSELGYLLRAAALADLLMHGHLVDESGKPRVATPPKNRDPTLMPVWDQIAEAPPRSWRRWINDGHGRAVRLVRDELAATGVIKLEPRRILGIFPGTRISLRQPYLARRLQEQVGRAIRGGQPTARVDRTIGALAALAASGELRIVIGWAERRRFKSRIAQFSEPIEPVATALRKTITAVHAAAAAAG